MNWTEEQYQEYMKRTQTNKTPPKKRRKKSNTISQVDKQTIEKHLNKASTDDVIIKFNIPLKPITKKNSQQIVTNKKTGKPFIIQSEQYRDFEKECEPYMPSDFPTIDYPINLECRYFMKTRRKCDLINLLEATQDILVKYGVLEDDNFSIVASTDRSVVLYDKENPRTEITITHANEGYVKLWEMFNKK